MRKGRCLFTWFFGVLSLLFKLSIDCEYGQQLQAPDPWEISIFPVPGLLVALQKGSHLARMAGLEPKAKE